MTEEPETATAFHRRCYPLGGPDWLEKFQQEAQLLLDKAPGAMRNAKWSVIEQFDNAPAKTRTADGVEAGYVMTIHGGKVAVRPGVRPDDKAPVRITLDWTAACELAGLPSGPELRAATARHVKAGRIRSKGDLATAPISFPDLHDRMVSWTQRP